MSKYPNKIHLKQCLTRSEQARLLLFLISFTSSRRTAPGKNVLQKLAFAMKPVSKGIGENPNIHASGPINTEEINDSESHTVLKVDS